MRRRSWLGGIIAGVALAACFPPSVNIVGKECDALHGCGDELSCLGGICVAPAGPAVCGPPAGITSLLPNGGFAAGLTAWSGGSSPVDLTTVDTPAHLTPPALRVQPTSGAGAETYFRVLSDPLTLESPAPARLCARACTRRGDVAPRRVSMTLRGHAGANTPVDGLIEAELVPEESWRSLDTQIDTAGYDAVSVRVSMTINAGSGASFYLDDVAVWAPDDGECP